MGREVCKMVKKAILAGSWTKKRNPKNKNKKKTKIDRQKQRTRRRFRKIQERALYGKGSARIRPDVLEDEKGQRRHVEERKNERNRVKRGEKQGGGLTSLDESWERRGED